MGMFELMSIASTGFIFLIPALTLPFLYIYLVHDYAGRRQGDRDPRLGAKVFCALTMTIAGQLVLGGIAAVGVAVVDGHMPSIMKTGSGLVLAGVIVGLFPTFFYFARVRTEGGARIGHQALGLNALMSGIAFAGAVVAACQAAFHDGEVKQLAVVAAVYGTAMVVAGLRLEKSPIPAAQVRRD